MPRFFISGTSAAALAASLIIAAAFASASAPGEAPRRIAAPWEPVDTVLVRWPPAHPPVVFRELDEAASLTFLVSGQSQQNAAIDYCIGLGIDPVRLSFITTGQVSQWPRDWGPYCIFTEDGAMALADPLWAGYPYAGQYCADPGSVWTPSTPADATANTTIAAALDLPRIPLGYHATGGNLLTDGFGRAFSSCILLSENLPLMTEAALREQAETTMGVADSIILANWESYGIQHVDCWAKFIDEETVLVKRPPAGHPEQGPTEANIAILESLETPWGNPYTIIRVDCPPYSAGNLANYLNSYIVNDRVLVPVFGIPADEAAIDIYRAAMPGYRIVAVPAAGFYNHTDAVHCRTRSIHDREMLRIAHPRIRADQPLHEAVEASAFIDDRSGSGLIESQTLLHWREAGVGAWSSTPLEPAPAPGDKWRSAQIDSLSSPTEIEYYIEAADNSGRVSFMPPVGVAGAQRFLATDGGLRIIPVDLPDAAPPGVAAGTIVTVEIDPGADALVPGSATAHVRTSPGDDFTAAPMTAQGDGRYSFTVPPLSCADAPEVHFTALGASGAQRRWPAQPGLSHTFPVVEAVDALSLEVVFDAPALPAGVGATGLWTVIAGCAPSGACDGAGGFHAAFALPQTCEYDTGQRETGDLAMPPVEIAPDAIEAELTFCHFLHTENTQFGDQGYDAASVLVNGQVMATLSDSLEWSERTIDLLAFAGQTVHIVFRFDTIDEQYNAYPGWRIGAARVRQTSPQCVAACPADLSGDGNVGSADLGALLGMWGPCAAPCPADLTGDGLVGSADLGALLGSWGPCP